jgi:signal transduction histidine kinase
MITRYREIFFGVLFGLTASVIDIIMHAGMHGHSFAEELIHPDMGMLFYRLLFVAFGVAFGSLLWKKNQRERESRHLAEALDKLSREIAAPAIIIRTQAQLLLTREHPALSAQVEVAVRTIYEQSTRLQSLTNRARFS